MSLQKQPNTQPFIGKHDENILVVKRNDLFPQGAWHGINGIDDKDFIETVLAKKEFLPRSLMETDPTYKQIIPYLIFENNGKYFLMQRQAKASETRLQSKYSFGIGGHIRQDDINDADIISWARREFHEEVDYNGSFTVEQIGILNDDSNDVGKVHVGFVYLLKGDSTHISVKEELQNGRLLSLQECEAYYENMESWSKMVFDWLKKNQ